MSRFFRLQVKHLSDHCRWHLQTMVDVDPENLKSLLELVVTFPQLEVLTTKVEKFIASEWKALTDSGLLAVVMEDGRFRDLVTGAVSKYMARKPKDDDDD